MESVIEGLMYSSNQLVKCGLPSFRTPSTIFLTLWKVTDLIVPPELNQARVNKCLIALVNRKIVHKENSTVCIIFVALRYLILSNVLRGLSCITGRVYLDVSKASLP